MLLLLEFGWTTLAGGFLGLLILTPIFYFFFHGFARKSPLFLKGRELILSAGLRDWVVWGVGALFFFAFLFLFGLLGTVDRILGPGARRGVGVSFRVRPADRRGARAGNR